jgi:hypothetical protein
MDFGLLPMSEQNPIQNETISSFLKEKKSVILSANYSREDGQLRQAKQAQTYAEFHQRKNSKRNQNLTNLAHLAPNEKVGAGFSQQFGNFHELNSTDLDSMSLSYQTRVDIFGKNA